jgi:hypothetical protein
MLGQRAIGAKEIAYEADMLPGGDSPKGTYGSFMYEI